MMRWISRIAAAVFSRAEAATGRVATRRRHRDADTDELATPGAYWKQFPITGGRSVALAVTDQGILPASSAGITIEYAGIVFSPACDPRQLVLSWAWAFNSSTRRKIASVTVVDVSAGSDETTCVHDPEPVLFDARWEGAGQAVVASPQTVAWVYEDSLTVRVFRFDIRFADGAEISIHQASQFALDLKLAFRQQIANHARIELPELPSGFRWTRFPPGHSAHPVPDGWHLRREHSRQGAALYVTPEPLSADGIFETGLTAFAFPFATPADFQALVDSWQRTVNERYEVLERSEDSGPGGLRRIHVLSRSRNKPILIKTEARVDRERGQLRIHVFEAPEAEWDSAWAIGQTLMRVAEL